MAEFLVNAAPTKQFFHASQLAPMDGALPLPSTPGLGIELDPERIDAEVELS